MVKLQKCYKFKNYVVKSLGYLQIYNFIKGINS